MLNSFWTCLTPSGHAQKPSSICLNSLWICSTSIGIGTSGIRCGVAGVDAVPRECYWITADVDLADTLRKFYRDRLQMDPRERRVLVCQPAHATHPWKQKLVECFLHQLEVPEVQFLPSPVLGLLLFPDTRTGLTVDVGHSQSSVLPVVDYLPLDTFAHYQSMPIGGHALARYLRYLVLRHARIQWDHCAPERPLPDLEKQLTNTDNSVRNAHIPVPSEWPDSLWSDMLVRTCFIARDRSSSAKKNAKHVRYPLPWLYSESAGGGCLQQQKGQVMELILPGWIRSQVGELLWRREGQRLLSQLVPSNNHFGVSESEVRGKSDGKDTAADVGYLDTDPDASFLCDTLQQACLTDDECASLPYMILEGILKSPMDVRRHLANNIIVMGGVSQMPGFPLRLLWELKDRLECDPRYRALQSLSSVLRIRTRRGQADCMAWMSASMLGSSRFTWAPECTITRPPHEGGR